MQLGFDRKPIGKQVGTVVSLEPFPFPDSRDHLSEPPGPFSFPDSTFYFLYFLLSLVLLSLVQIPDFLQYDGLRAPWEWT